jgi:hypothetical protein
MKNAVIYTAIVSLAATLFAVTPVQAKQYTTADGKVAHTRLAPVVAHRMSPPFKGQHVYRRAR